MAKDVYMPALGMNQETGTLLRWLKQEGETVRKGEPLMEIATDKTDVEIEAPADGVLRNVTAVEGDEVPVGHVIALIAGPDEKVPPPANGKRAAKDEVAVKAEDAPDPTKSALPAAAAPSGGQLPVSPVAARVAAEHGVDLALVKAAGNRIQKEDVLAYVAAQKKDTARERVPSTAGGRTLASPKARRLAAEQGVALAELLGSGPDGAVLAADVVEAQTRPQAPAVQPISQPVAPQPAAAEGETIPMSRMWKVMAERLTASWTSVPHFFLSREVDATRLIAWRVEAQARSQEKITYTDLLVKAVAAALRQHPRVNAGWLNGTIIANQAVNIGLAVAVDDGLLVPVIHGADGLGLSELAARRADIVSRAQAGKVTMDDLTGGTFTISNLGMFGIDTFQAIINPPQAAILAVGRIVDKVVAVGGQPAVRPIISFTLSSDHRVVDGARAARFLESVAAFVEDPLRMLD
jgi:pyruvate dehydrogenase E2 component (dihydrolipoamide acetyltransferase)